MIKSSTGEVCTPNDDIKALDLHGTNALRAKLLQIQADSGTGEEALLAEAEIAVGVERAEAEQAQQAEIDKAQQALLEFRDYLAQSPGSAAQALPEDDQLVYNYNPDTQQCEITRLDRAPMVLDISGSGLDGELPLPPQLMVAELNCHTNQLTALPKLPTSLTRLNCSSNHLTTLPEVLPPSLTMLRCRNNQLTTLPEVLPTSLTVLNCGSNQLTKLPEVLPTSLSVLHCANNQLTTLPEVLPASLTELYCSGNQLTSLPEVLPTSLTTLHCANNQLRDLPEVLPASLTRLHCSNNPKLRNNPVAQKALQELRDRGATVRS